MTETTPVPSRLALLFKARREELQLTQEDVASRVTALLPPSKRLTQQSYAAFEKGKSQTSRHAIAIAQALNLPPDVLSDQWRHSPQNIESLANAKLIAEPILIWDEKTPLADEVEVPLLKEGELSDGSGRTALQEHGKVKLGISKTTLQEMGVDPANIICASVTGNSMEPVIPDGNTVGIDKGKTSVRDGDLFALRHNNQLRVRMLYRLPIGGLRMRSFNRDEHPDEEYSDERIKAENIEILGRVFWYSVLR